MKLTFATIRPPLFFTLALALAAGIGACGQSNPATSQSATANAGSGIPVATPKAVCGPGSHPETGMQGRISSTDIGSGYAAKGYTCNTELVGSYSTPNAQGTQGGFKVLRYTDAAGHDCAFYDTTLMFPTNLVNLPSPDAGVNVLDMTDPTHPLLTAQLQTPAMLSPHESLALSKTGILAAVLGNAAFGPAVVDVYDVSQDCRHPVEKSSTPIAAFGHESGMAPDGKTFYAASPFTNTLVPVDISNPSAPVMMGSYAIGSHGLSISDDGNRAYVASTLSASGTPFTGLIILDTSDFQSRKPNPQFREISRLTWDTISIPQNAMPFTLKGHPYLLEIDEFSTDGTPGFPSAGNGKTVGAGRIIDIGDETHPKVISNLRLEVHQPENRATIANDPGADNPVGGYAGHYCNVPTRTDPTIVACSMIISGLRVFDIRDPYHPKEIAYFNPPLTPHFGSSVISGIPIGSAIETNWAMSKPAFVPERHEIWYSDGLGGFFAVRLTNNAWPTN